jgi:hypothetical protein
MKNADLPSLKGDQGDKQDTSLLNFHVSNYDQEPPKNTIALTI